MKISKCCLTDLWENIKQANTCIIQVPEREEREREKRPENISEETRGTQGKQIFTEFQEVQSPIQDSSTKELTTTCYNQNDIIKDKERILKSRR